MGEKEGEVDPVGSFQEAVEHAKDQFEKAQVDAEVAKSTNPRKLSPDDTQEVKLYSIAAGVWKAAFPVISGALTVAVIAVLDYALETDYLAGKASPIIVIGVTAAARFVQNYLKQHKKKE